MKLNQYQSMEESEKGTAYHPDHLRTRGYEKILAKDILESIKLMAIQLLQELKEDVFDRSGQLCEIVTKRANGNVNFLFNTYFSNEGTFFFNGIGNRYNCRSWTYSNSRMFPEAHKQNSQKWKVWAGIFGDEISLLAFFLPGILTDDMYLDLLENAIDPAITIITETNPAYTEQELIF